LIASAVALLTGADARKAAPHAVAAGALPLGAMPLDLAVAVAVGWPEECVVVVVGREAEEVVERGIGGVERVVDEAEQRVGDLGVDVLEEAHVR